VLVNVSRNYVRWQSMANMHIFVCVCVLLDLADHKEPANAMNARMMKIHMTCSSAHLINC